LWHVLCILICFQDSKSLFKAQAKLKQATERIVELEESIEGKQLALDRVISENTKLKETSLQEKVHNKGENILSLDFLYLYPIIMQFFLQNVHLYRLLMDHKKICNFFLKCGLIVAQILKFHILEDIFNTWNSKARKMSKIQWAQHFTVSSTLLWQAI
jgi:hypothetical protein